MVQTRSQTKKQEEEVEEEVKVSFIADHGVWNLVYDMFGTYYVVTDNYYTERDGDNYHEFKAEDYAGGEPTAYRHALKCYYSRV